MDRNTGISAVEYQLEWIDHLYELYGEFGRRNDLNEWIVFFRRPEMADPHEHDKIAAEVLKYLTKYEHISQGIVKYIESVFKYCDSEKKYEDVIRF